VRLLLLLILLIAIVTLYPDLGALCLIKGVALVMEIVLGYSALCDGCVAESALKVGDLLLPVS
jgi:hypothetical protein